MKLQDSVRRIVALLLSLLFLLALLPVAAGATEETKHKVTFHCTVNGYPWQNIIIYVYDTEGTVVNGGVSNASGDLVLDMPEGNYTYSSVYGGSVKISSVSNRPIAVSGGDLTIPVELTTTTTPTHPVQISVADQNGNPVDGALVKLVDFGYSDIENVVASGKTANGVATLNVGAGVSLYAVRVSKFGYSPYCDDAGVVDVYEDGRVSGKTSIVLQPVTGAYDAAFTVNSNGVFLNGAEVTVYYNGDQVDSRMTDAQGKALVSGLPDGKYTYDVVCPGYAPLTNQNMVINGANQDVTVELPASAETTAITGKVTTDSGIGTVTLALYKGTKDSPGEKVTEQTIVLSGEAAAFTVEPTAPLAGEYFLKASCEGFTSCYVCGITGAVDIAETLELYGGDLSGDGNVNDDDYLLFMAEYAKGGTAGGIADVNHDGAVNDDDYLLFMANYANAEKSQDKVITL